MSVCVCVCVRVEVIVYQVAIFQQSVFDITESSALNAIPLFALYHRGWCSLQGK